MDDKVDKGFEINYWKLSYRRKFIRTLWVSPIVILAVYLNPDIFSTLVFRLLVILSCAVLVAYNFYKWQRTE